MVSLKKKSESLIKYYIKVTCPLKWARKLPRKTETYESATCVPCNTRKCTHNGFVSDLLKWALKCRFYAPGPWFLAGQNISQTNQKFVWQTFRAFCHSNSSGLPWIKCFTMKRRLHWHIFWTILLRIPNSSVNIQLLNFKHHVLWQCQTIRFHNKVQKLVPVHCVVTQRSSSVLRDDTKSAE